MQSVNQYRKGRDSVRRVWKTPELDYYNLYADMLQQPHLLIAGATGSGKSVVINGMMTTALKDSPAAVQFILIDPKRVELVDYKELPHTLRYSSEPGEMVQALQEAIVITDNRYRDMARQHVKKYGGGAVYVVIDELADLMTTNKKQVQEGKHKVQPVKRNTQVHLLPSPQTSSWFSFPIPFVAYLPCLQEGSPTYHRRSVYHGRNLPTFS